MGKIINAIKKPGKKVAVKEEEKVTCESCNGTGLIDRDNLCVLCDGSGQK